MNGRGVGAAPVLLYSSWVLFRAAVRTIPPPVAESKRATSARPLISAAWIGTIGVVGKVPPLKGLLEPSGNAVSTGLVSLSGHVSPLKGRLGIHRECRFYRACVPIGTCFTAEGACGTDRERPFYGAVVLVGHFPCCIGYGELRQSRMAPTGAKAR